MRDFPIRILCREKNAGDPAHCHHKHGDPALHQDCSSLQANVNGQSSLNRSGTEVGDSGTLPDTHSWKGSNERDDGMDSEEGAPSL